MLDKSMYFIILKKKLDYFLASGVIVLCLIKSCLFIYFFFRENNKISVFSVKVALATLCAGKLMDKFRCKSQIISLIS